MATHLTTVEGKPLETTVEIEKADNTTFTSLAETKEIVVDEELRRKRRRIKLKIDLRLVPILGAMYAISGIDRTNLAVARLAGMDKELGFNKGNRYSVALLVFFITYFIFEIPSNIALRKFGAARWLSFLCFAWGICILGSGFVHKWRDIVGIRLLTGAFEAGFIPGCLYLMSSWYERYQLQKRISLFYGVSLLAGGFGNILAYGIMHMQGDAGYAGWRWIFIIEGLIPIALAGLGYLLIVDFPDKVLQKRWPFLTPEEVQITMDRLYLDRADSEYDGLNLRKVIRILGIWQLWVYAFIFLGAGVGSYAFSYFIQQILVGMGYKINMVFLLSAPPSIAAIPFSFGVAWLADKTKYRAPFVIFQSIVCLVGLMLTAYCHNNGVRYFGVFLGVAGSNGNLPAILTWQANNIRGQSTRAVATGLQVAAGAIGGIYASTTYIQKQAPKYRGGLWATAAMQFAMIAVTCAMTLYHISANRKADRSGKIIAGLEGFRYTL